MKNAGETYEEQAKKEVQLCTLEAPGFIMEEAATKATRQPCWRSWARQIAITICDLATDALCCTAMAGTRPAAPSVIGTRQFD
ncbi:hypothetical protein HKD37_03G006826 [Glycine soja]